MSNFWGAYQTKKLAPKPKFQRKQLFKIMEKLFS